MPSGARPASTHESDINPASPATLHSAGSGRGHAAATGVPTGVSVEQTHRMLSGMEAARRAEAVAGAQRSSSASAHSTPHASRPPMVLTPTHLRIVSKTMLWHTTCCWLTNAMFAGLLLGKLSGSLSLVSWWVIFCPMWLQHFVYVPLQLLVIADRHTAIYRQLGPAPPATASSGLQLQYATLHGMRMRTHIIDAINAMVDSVSMLATKALFCWCLEADGGFDSVPLRLVFAPLWVGWVVATLITCMKDRAERLFGSTRDLLNVFMVFVAVKVDGQVDFSWSVVFVVPWMYFSAMFLIALVVMVVLLFARVWARARELLLPLGFFLLLASTAPQFASYIALVQLLDESLDQPPTLSDILVPNIVSWCCMWVSSLLLGWGLRQKERMRDALLASGAVWTMHEHVARRLRNQDQDALRAKIDRMSEEEVAALVTEAMAGKPKPQALVRVGNTLYKRGEAGQDGDATPAGTGAAGRGAAGAGAGAGVVEQRGEALGRGKGEEAAGGGGGGGFRLLRTSTRLPTADMGAGLWDVESYAAGADLESFRAAARGAGQRDASEAVAAAAGVQSEREVLEAGPGAGEAKGTWGSGEGVLAPAPEPVCVVVLSGDAAGDVNGPPLRPHTSVSAAAAAAAVHEPGGPHAAAALGAVPAAGAGFVGGAAAAGSCRSSSGSGASSSSSGGSGGRGGSLNSGVAGSSNGCDVEEQGQRQQKHQGQGQGQDVGDGQELRQGQGQEQGQHRATPNSKPHAMLALRTEAHPQHGHRGPRSPHSPHFSSHTNGPASGPAAAAPPFTAPSSRSIVLPSLATTSLNLNLAVEVDRNLGLEGTGQTLTPLAGSNDSSAAQQGPRSTGAGTGAGAETGAGAGAGAGAVAGGACVPPDATSIPVDAADDTCIICYDGAATCVFLDCGHGGFCQRCAYLLYVRPPSECPTCRAVIEQVVRLSEVRGIGELCPVRS